MLKKRTDDGFSLIEVVIAAVILGLVSISLINGLNTVNLTSKKQLVATTEYANLATAEVLLQRTPFVACTTADPYSANATLKAQLDAINVQITEVKGISMADTTNWVVCAAGNSGPPNVIQQITVKALTGHMASRTVLKGSNGTYPLLGDVFPSLNNSSDPNYALRVLPYAVELASQQTTFTLLSGCSPTACDYTDTARIGGYNPNSATTKYFILGKDSSSTTATLSGTSLTIARTASGTGWVLVGAFDTTTNAVARPVRIYGNAISAPTATVNYPSGATNFTAVVGYGFYPTTQTPTVTFSLDPSYSIDSTSVSGTALTLSTTGTTGTLAIANAANLSSSTAINETVSVKCCGFTDSRATGTATVKVVSTPALAIGSAPSMNTACATFMSTTSAAPCIVTATYTGGSAVLDADAACRTITLPTFTNATSATCAYASGTATVTVKYFAANKTISKLAKTDICYGKTTNQTFALPAYTITDATAGSQAFASVSVTCK